MAVNGVGFALHWPAAVGLVPLVVERERLQPANALLSLSQSAAFAPGRGVRPAFSWRWPARAGRSGSTHVTFLASAALVAGLRTRVQDRTRRVGEPGSHELRESASTEFVSHRWLWAIVAQFSLVVAGWSGCFAVVGPDRCRPASWAVPTAWGWVAGAFGLGLVAGGILGMQACRCSARCCVATLCMFSFAMPAAAPLGARWRCR